MSKITENDIEIFTIELFEGLWYSYIYAHDLERKPEDVLFVNGLPLMVIELKNAVDENATVRSAHNQIGTYKSQIPKLFVYNAFCVISDGIEAKAGTISADIWCGKQAMARNAF